jgi:hypothetical protein
LPEELRAGLGVKTTASRQHARPHLREHLGGGHGRHGPVFDAIQARVQLGRPRAVPGVAVEGLPDLVVVEVVEQFREQALPFGIGEGEDLLGERGDGHDRIYSRVWGACPSRGGGPHSMVRWGLRGV